MIEDNRTVVTVTVACPTCGEQIPIPIYVAFGADADGYPVIAATPGVSAAWDHYEDRHMTEPEVTR